MYYGSRDPAEYNAYLSSLKDRICNAISIGMGRSDAYLLAEASPDEIELLEKDTVFLSRASSAERRLEERLLQKLGDVIDAQVRRGKHAALTWSLEHLFDRYYKGGAQDGPVGTINLKIGTTEGADIEVHATGINTGEEGNTHE